MKFLTPRGIATLVTRSAAISECRKLEARQTMPEEDEKVKEDEPEINLSEEIMVNPAYPDQLVKIGGGLTKECKTLLKTLLVKNLDIFAWEPSDMTGVPRLIIEHSLNANPSVDPVCQKRRVFAPDRSQAVLKEVKEWVCAGIVRPVRYPTWISNPVLVKKCDGSWRMCVDFKNNPIAEPMNTHCYNYVFILHARVVGFDIAQ
ncbi:reverse transcriptase domain-containing protein [Artemisia annua]|uniref:Reverse transcriptase domain-containing protein n=1 Tax=Artemisia annua TaxID=35608 RepID=A0A2U1NHG6_ARTAN|nr:reverse transcriptase domain-containing protein [Artemisia annua]